MLPAKMYGFQNRDVLPEGRRLNFERMIRSDI